MTTQDREPPVEALRRAGTDMRQRATAASDWPPPPLLGPLGDLLMALADEMADYPAVHVPNGIGIAARPNHPSAVWTAAYHVATTWTRDRPKDSP